MRPEKLWTIGHSNHALETFLGLLKSHAIEALADVRLLPGSRRYPQFNSEDLALSLAKRQIEYVHFPELGGRRKPRKDSLNIAWRNESFRGYADYMEGPEFRDGIQRLEGLAAAKRTAVTCAEVLWWQCHRAMISDFEKSRGVEVLHILSGEKCEPHPYTSAARIIDGELSYREREEAAQPELRL